MTADELLPDQTVDAVYPTRAFAGQVGTIDEPVTCGVPVSSILSDVGLGSTTASFVGIAHVGDSAAPSWATLSHSDLFDPSSIYPGGLVPVVHFDGDVANGYTVRYLRPLTADPDDANVPDKVNAAPGSAFDLYVGNGSLLTVTASASPSAPKAGQPITFTAGSTPATRSPSYRWDFGPGTRPEIGATVTHAFPAAGTYDVSVMATSPDGSAGTLANPLAVTVGSVPSASASPSATPTGRRPPSSPHPGTTRTSSAVATSSPTVTATPQPTHPAAGVHASPRSSASPAEGSSSPPPVAIRLAGDARPLVTGRLIGGPVAAPGGSTGGPQSATAIGGAGTSMRRWIIGSAAGVAIMLLFAAGAGRELRGSSRPRRSVERPR